MFVFVYFMVKFLSLNRKAFKWKLLFSYFTYIFGGRNFTNNIATNAKTKFTPKSKTIVQNSFKKLIFSI